MLSIYHLPILLCTTQIIMTAEPPQQPTQLKPRILHGFNVYPERKQALAIIKEDRKNSGYYWNPLSSALKIAKSFTDSDYNPITATRIWGALIALKKKLPAYKLTKEIIAQIALYLVTSPSYNQHEQCFIAYEFISDANYDSVRPAWLLQFFESFKVNHITYCSIYPKNIFCTGSQLVTRHHYHKVIECQRCFSYLEWTKLNKEINNSSNDYEQIKPIINQPTNPRNALKYEAAAICVQNNKITLLKQLAAEINLAHIQTPHHKNLLHFAKTPEMVDLLLAHNIAVNQIDDAGITPLLSALDWGKFANNATQVMVVKKMLAVHALVKTNEYNALEYAQKNGCCDEIIEVLKQA